MDKKTTGLIATIATALLCGCPGLIGLCIGATSVFASFMPNADIDVFGSNDPAAATTMGFVFLCLSVIFIAIPIVVGVVTLRKPKEEVPAVVDVKPTEVPAAEPTPADKSEQSKPPAPPSEKPDKPADDEPLPPAS
jgi:Na+-transporting methylmalonyl-CoA/oxaloacetate decarboxylase gamma subunit